MTQHDFTVILNLAVRRLISCTLIPLNDTSSLNFRFPRKHLTGNISTLCDSLTINMSWRKEEFLHQPCVYSAGFAPRLFQPFPDWSIANFILSPSSRLLSRSRQKQVIETAGGIQEITRNHRDCLAPTRHVLTSVTSSERSDDRKYVCCSQATKVQVRNSVIGPLNPGKICQILFLLGPALGVGYETGRGTENSVDIVFIF